MKLWSDIAEKTVTKVRVYNNLGDAFLETGKYDEAISYLKFAVKADPWYLEPHYNMAVSYVKKKQYDEAIPEFEEVLRINDVLKKGHYGSRERPRHEVVAHANLGNIYNMKGMFDRAISHYKDALDIDPKDVSTRFNLAMTYKMLGDISRGRAEFEEVLRINPDDREARRNLAEMQR